MGVGEACLELECSNERGETEIGEAQPESTEPARGVPPGATILGECCDEESSHATLGAGRELKNPRFGPGLARRTEGSQRARRSLQRRPLATLGVTTFTSPSVVTRTFGIARSTR